MTMTLDDTRPVRLLALALLLLGLAGCGLLEASGNETEIGSIGSQVEAGGTEPSTSTTAAEDRAYCDALTMMYEDGARTLSLFTLGDPVVDILTYGESARAAAALAPGQHAVVLNRIVELTEEVGATTIDGDIQVDYAERLLEISLLSMRPIDDFAGEVCRIDEELFPWLTLAGIVTVGEPVAGARSAWRDVTDCTIVDDETFTVTVLSSGDRTASYTGGVRFLDSPTELSDRSETFFATSLRPGETAVLTVETWDEVSGTGCVLEHVQRIDHDATAPHPEDGCTVVGTDEVWERVELELTGFNDPIYGGGGNVIWALTDADGVRVETGLLTLRNAPAGETETQATSTEHLYEGPLTCEVIARQPIDEDGYFACFSGGEPCVDDDDDEADDEPVDEDGGN
ncbi:MAG: hypothetical protein AAF547_02645 [Actinomycetota bacterium]